jgi:hypothetical protein
MMNKFSCTLIMYLSYLNLLSSQNTVGLSALDNKQAFDGYTFVYPVNVSNHFLINNCGEKLHEWVDSTIFVGGPSYLGKNGDLYKTKRLRDNSKDKIFAPGAASVIEIRDWNNTIKWKYELNNDSLRLHHDIEILPNGNILAVIWELKSKVECIKAGRDTTTIPAIGLYNEIIREINPNNNSIVWQWSAWDHLIQDFDSRQNNFGILKDNPQKININSNKAGTVGLPLEDWMHINSIDFNPELNQIMFSAPTFGEIYIIDHSTTTAQAKTNTGGLSKKGGDLMYRWGNEINYIKDSPKPQQLFFQHDARWILNVAANHPEYGKISVFNNRFAADQSLPSILVSPWDMYTWTYTDLNKKYGPVAAEKTFITNKAKQQSNITSSLQLLPNNNFLICAGARGYHYEINAKNEVVWEYVLPYKATGPVAQGTNLALQDNTIFNTWKYAKNYSAFVGRDLSPKGFIELNPNKDYCSKITSTDEKEVEIIKIFPNPAKRFIQIETQEADEISFFDIAGKLVLKDKLMKGFNYLPIDLSTGVYIAEFKNQKERRKVIVN